MTALVDSVARLGHVALDVFFPPRCVACDALAARVFCRTCDGQIVRTASTGDAKANVAALVAYEGPVSVALRRAKYGPDEAVARALARFLVDELRAQPDVHNVLTGAGLTAVVWVPAHWRRRFMRRFDLPQVFAARLSHALAVPTKGALRPTVYAPPRASGAREESLVGRYAVTRPVRGETLLLVDDVITTGATLEAAASALEEAGAVVHRFALAHTPKRGIV